MRPQGETAVQIPSTAQLTMSIALAAGSKPRIRKLLFTFLKRKISTKAQARSEPTK
jgi:hypothetical protein